MAGRRCHGIRAVTTVAEEQKTARRPFARGLSGWLDRLGEGRFAAVVAAPGLLLVLLVIAPPILAAIGFSFFRIELAAPGAEPFVALRNYVVRLPADTGVPGHAARERSCFAAVVTVVAVPVGTGCGVARSRTQAGRPGVLALLLILPWAVAPIGDGLLWRLLFDPDYGIVGKLLRYARLPPVRIQTAEGSFLAMLVAVTWRAMPLLGVLFLGALRQVPQDLLKAARMDGASSWQTFRRVTLPIIAPTVIAATLIELILALQVFDVQFALTADQPPKGTELVATHIFKSGHRVDLARVWRDRDDGAGAVRRGRDLAAVGCSWFGAISGLIRPRHVTMSVHSPNAGQRRRTWPRRGDGRTRSSSRAAHAAPVGLWQGIHRGWPRSSWAIWVLGPLVWVLIGSVQADVFLDQDPPKLALPLLLSIYQAFLASDIWRGAAVISILVATTATLCALVIAALAAYPLARYRFRGGRILLMGDGWPRSSSRPSRSRCQFCTSSFGWNCTTRPPVSSSWNIAFWTPVLVWLLRAAFLAVPRNLDAGGSDRRQFTSRRRLPSGDPRGSAGHRCGDRDRVHRHLERLRVHRHDRRSRHPHAIEFPR